MPSAHHWRILSSRAYDLRTGSSALKAWHTKNLTPHPRGPTHAHTETPAASRWRQGSPAVEIPPPPPPRHRTTSELGRGDVLVGGGGELGGEAISQLRRPLSCTYQQEAADKNLAAVLRAWCCVGASYYMYFV